MTRFVVRWYGLAVLLLCAAQASAAQQAMTITGHVTYDRSPLAGAHVRVVQLGLERITDADGRYSFIVPSVSVRGQAVTLMARVDDRRVLYLPQSVEIVLNGRALVQDFVLTIAANRDATRERSEAVVSNESLFGESLDLTTLPGNLTLAEALAGRVPGLDVRAASSVGGSTALAYRGARSLAGSGQPLFVVDGLPIVNDVFTSSAQRQGAGGFDYGSAVQDLELSSISNVRFIRGPEAIARYGGRAANGVVQVTTLHRGDVLGLSIAATQQLSSESPLRLPAFQNQYGQGLDGRFAFFDGRGGGINDNVDQSWGPALDGRALQQASLTEAMRPDVRLWVPMPNNVRDYFGGGRTVSTTAALNRAGSSGSWRLFFGNHDSHGFTPAQSLIRRDGGFTLATRTDARLSVSAQGSIAHTANVNSPGTGFNQENPVSIFTRMGRQVDVAALASHLRDSLGRQISWNYAGQNNPWFAALANHNESVRTHGTGGASATYAAASWLTATLQGGLDDYTESRRARIAPGWMGGVPSLAGPSTALTGGAQDDDISVQRTSIAFRLQAERQLGLSTRWTSSIGVDREGTREHLTSMGSDSLALVPEGAAVTDWIGQETRTGAFAQTGLQLGNRFRFDAGLRNEWLDVGLGSTAATLYPAVSASLDLGNGSPSGAFNGLIVRGGWSRSGADVSPYALQTLYAGDEPSSRIVPRATVLDDSAAIRPEVTDAAEAGLTFAFAGRRLMLSATAYSDRTSNLVLPVLDQLQGLTIANTSGAITNRGIESSIALHLGDAASRFAWSMSATAAHNVNEVQSLGGAGLVTALGPAQGGLTIQARVGAPFGELVGLGLLRDSISGALVLRNGLPQADSSTGPHPLGSSQPTWLYGLTNRIRYHWLTLAIVADAHVGGSIFSMTRQSAAYAGTLAETGFRPDSGLLIAGIDAATGRPNAKHVSTQDYYHAIGVIAEPWVTSASYAKLREARLSASLSTGFWNLPFESATVSLVGRNLLMWSQTRDVDPEAIVTAGALRGLELGQLPAARSVGLQLTLTP